MRAARGHAADPQRVRPLQKIKSPATARRDLRDRQPLRTSPADQRLRSTRPSRRRARARRGCAAGSRTRCASSRSAHKATKDIAVLIKNVQSDTQDAGGSGAGTHEVESGYRMTVQAGESLKTIALSPGARPSQDISRRRQQQARRRERRLGHAVHSVRRRPDRAQCRRGPPHCGRASPTSPRSHRRPRTVQAGC